MPSASDTAYPRLKTNPSATELGEIYAPNIFELVCEASDGIGKVGSLSYWVGHPKGEGNRASIAEGNAVA